ncbi:MAG TPA: aldehyde dehydrogenase family protein, partial [Gemmataceae bacterium]|nr:aldehyde dehydrogenase family protein [Gemmataceae bacterium]
MLQVNDDLIRSVVSEVLGFMRTSPAGPAPARSSRWGVYDNVDEAAQAASRDQKKFEAMGMSARKAAVDCVRKICIDRAEELGREEFEETKIGRLAHKAQKLVVAGERTPGVEWLKTDAYTGEHGIALVEYAPFGVVGIITPVTHSLPTLAGNAINILAAGNALLCNPHPSGAKIACKGVRLFNQAIHAAIGLDSLLTIIESPTLESAEAIFQHREVRLICVTGGPAVGRAALRSPKRAIVAGPGNPPVVVDETADLDNAARSIIAGAAYDNNLLCIGEKEVFAVASIFDDLMSAMERAGAVRLNATQIDALTKAAFPKEGDKLVLHKDLIGVDAAVLAAKAGMKIPASTE